MDHKITHIFETHRNEDYVAGSLELQSYVADAEIGHSKATQFGYGDITISDGEMFQIGMMSVTCLNTPGHTDDSMCYAVADTTVSPNPIVVFTGDTLFVNEVGRTDLVDINKHAQMSKKLYTSLHEKVLPLGDAVIIHPGHGAGSVCGGAIGDREFSTIGYERKNNIWLTMDEDEFIRSKVNQRLTHSSYFKRCEKLNTEGPPLLSSLKPVIEFEVDEYENMLLHPDQRGIDTRRSADFLESHIPRSISMSLANIGQLAGWALRSNQTFTFIFNDISDLELARNSFYRVGLDNVVGYLKDGFRGWRDSGKRVESIPTISSRDLNDALKKDMLRIIDVRESHEYEKEWISTSRSSPLTRLEEEVSDIDSTEKIVTVCPSGFRSTTAASIMKRNGIDDVTVFLSGLKKWKADGYPMRN
ncbi:MAG: MBL fold metallo-hydrolase, partial [Candidatus Thorarchaeota archaeon]|nr:MBL fold metallo-hydrolase [Candidatus Thorarchaeota archaeon]